MDTRTNITRRTAIVGIAASAAALPVSGAWAAPEMAVLIETHRHAAAANEEAISLYVALSEKTALPSVKVVIGVNGDTMEPCQWAYSISQIDRVVAERKSTWLRQTPEAFAQFDAWGEKKKAELIALEAERDRTERESGLDVLGHRLDAADDAEHDALEAMIAAQPVNMDEVHLKAQYLLELIGDDDNNDGGRLQYWVREVVTSFAGALGQKVGA